MALCGAIGLVAPAVLAWTAWAVGAPEPVLEGGAAAVGGSLAAAIPMAIVVSGAVDWYVILPFVRGVFGPPACRTDAHDVETLRAYVKYRITHRVLAEFIGWGGLALVAAIGLIALGRAAADDNTVASALASLSAGGILAYAAPRWKHGVTYFFAQNAGFGTWAGGRDGRYEYVEGVVVDVSIHPGVTLRADPDGRDHSVPLGNTATLSEIPSRSPTCSGRGCGGWLPRCEIGERAKDAARRAESAP
ncbi:MAG: hypothetical protein M3340_04130 [Actinomycetota bacterium]|nr:hypothetical protein [Actinomycetota bacterium]